MGVFRVAIDIDTRSEGDMVDITDLVEKAVKDSGLDQGMAMVFVPHSTAAVVTIENEPGLRSDLNDALERSFPKNIAYEHHLRWGDGNGHSHTRAAFLGASVSLPFDKGCLERGTWQQVVLMELDVTGRKRSLIIQLIGE